MAVGHEPWIVALSVVIAIQGAYVALGLTLRIGHAVGTARRLTLAAAAFTLAVAIWSMHFVGMLAVRVPFRLHYLVLPTLLSLLVSVFVVGLGVFVASLTPVRRWALPVAALIMGVGIATMHYIGMMALRGSVIMHHDPVYVGASVAVAVAASALALRFAFAPRRTLPLALAAAVLGVAISGMHYVAMAGLTLTPEPGGGDMGSDTALSPDVMAVVVAVVAFAVSAVFLLTLVPDHAPGTDGAVAQPVPPEALPGLERAPAAGPLGGAGGPRLRQPAAGLPVERQGRQQMLPVDAIVFVQADTHYTSVFDGQARLFCPLSIGDVERRLDPARFLRVHRSTIVAVDRIAGLQRSGDGGTALFDTPQPASVSVSRTRYRALKSRIGTGAKAPTI